MCGKRRKVEWKDDEEEDGGDEGSKGLINGVSDRLASQYIADAGSDPVIGEQGQPPPLLPAGSSGDR